MKKAKKVLLMEKEIMKKKKITKKMVNLILTIEKKNE